MDPVLFKTRNEWRSWLLSHHDSESEIWVVYFKVKARKNGFVSLSYEEAVLEALCFGWIDSTVRTIDENRFMQRFSPRHAKSIWSATNKARIKQLEKEGIMHESGLKAVETARANGSWEALDQIDPQKVSADSPSGTSDDLLTNLPEDLQKALKKHPGTETVFASLSPSRKKQILWWLTSAKRQATRTRRLAEIIRGLLEEI